MAEVAAAEAQPPGTPGHEQTLARLQRLAPNEDGAGELDPAQAGGTLIGKRYVNADESIEILCTKGGKGSLVLDGVPLEVKQAKQLPSSD